MRNQSFAKDLVQSIFEYPVLIVKRSPARSITERQLVTISTVSHRRSRVTQFSLERTSSWQRAESIAIFSFRLIAAPRKVCPERLHSSCSSQTGRRFCSECCRSYGSSVKKDKNLIEAQLSDRWMQCA